MSDQSLPGSATSNVTPVHKANFWSALIIGLLCATVAYIAHQLIQRTSGHALRRLWTPIVVLPNGAETALAGATRRLEFWTPSSRTKDHLTRESGGVRERDNWEILANEEPVQQFGL